MPRRRAPRRAQGGRASDLKLDARGHLAIDLVGLDHAVEQSQQGWRLRVVGVTDPGRALLEQRCNAGLGATLSPSLTGARTSQSSSCE
jgi:hypothetical protein